MQILDVRLGYPESPCFLENRRFVPESRVDGRHRNLGRFRNGLNGGRHVALFRKEPASGDGYSLARRLSLPLPMPTQFLLDSHLAIVRLWLSYGHYDEGKRCGRLSILRTRQQITTPSGNC